MYQNLIAAGPWATLFRVRRLWAVFYAHKLMWGKKSKYNKIILRSLAFMPYILEQSSTPRHSTLLRSQSANKNGKMLIHCYVVFFCLFVCLFGSREWK